LGSPLDRFVDNVDMAGPGQAGPDWAGAAVNPS
jgi:hypothetical protein